MNDEEIKIASDDPTLRRTIVSTFKEYAGKLLTAHEAAARIGVSYSTVLRWRRQGRIPSVNVGGGVHRFTQETVLLENPIPQIRRPRCGV